MVVKINKLNDDEESYKFTITDGSVTDVIDLQLFCINMVSSIINDDMEVDVGDVNHEEITKNLNVEDVNRNLHYLRNEVQAKLDKINNDIDNLLN